MSLANGTRMQTAVGSRPVEIFAVGDMVLAGSGREGSWSWAPTAVQFSSGTGPGHWQPAMVYLRFGEDRELIVAPDQLLMTDGNRLQRAGLLVPGNSLIAADGTAVALDLVSMGGFQGGAHSIAMNIDASNAQWDGHLLVCAGVIGGDFWLQMRQEEQWMAQYLAPAV